MSGKVVHFEVPAEDVERAKSFYGQAFGWTFNSWGGEYHLVTTTPSDETGLPTEVGGINGGMLARQEPIQSPVIVIEVEDLEASLETVEGLGGTVARGKEVVGDMGFAAYVVDPEGNTIGLWQNAAG